MACEDENNFLIIRLISARKPSVLRITSAMREYLINGITCRLLKSINGKDDHCYSIMKRLMTSGQVRDRNNSHPVPVNAADCFRIGTDCLQMLKTVILQCVAVFQYQAGDHPG